MVATDSKNQKWKLERRRRRLARRLKMFGVTNDINLLRRRLETERQRLMQELEGLKTKHATEISGALEKLLGDRLAEVEHALDKFDRGTYGLCDNCGQPIDPGRLEALPQANLCLSCKTHLEKKKAKARQGKRVAYSDGKVTLPWTIANLIEDMDMGDESGLGKLE